MLTAQLQVTLTRGDRKIIDQIEDEWRELCNEGPCDEPFYRPEWIHSYLEAFAPQANILLLTARSSGQLRAVLPLVEQRVGVGPLSLRCWRAAANVHSCRFDVVHGDGDGDALVTAIWRFLAASPDWDILLLRDVPESGLFPQIKDRAASEGYPTATWNRVRVPYMPFPPPGSDQEAVLATKDRKLRNQLRRGMKKLAVEGGYRLVNVSSEASEAEIRAAIQAFYDLERGGWKGKAGTAIACDTKTIAFYNAIAREARRFDYLSIFLLEAGGRPVAGNLGFAWRGRYYFQKTAYDEILRQASPGNVLILELLCRGAELGLEEFDFLGVSQDYKERWTSLARSQAAYYLFRNNVGGRLMRTLMFEIGPRLKDRLPRSPLLDRIRKLFE